jgi:Pyocin activator protein PrtN
MSCLSGPNRLRHTWAHAPTVNCFSKPPIAEPMTSDDLHSAPTLYLLMAQYNGKTVVPIDQVCRDFFGHLTVENLRKALRGDLPLPIVRIETSQKAQRGVHLVDLAAYIDRRREAAIKDRDQLCGHSPVRR